MKLPEDVLDGIRFFNEGDYFEAHERWEDHWGLGPRPERELTLGLIKAAVALFHLRNGNVHGYEWQAERAMNLLREHAEHWPQLNLRELADGLESVGAQHRFHGDVSEDEYPKIRVDGSTHPPEAPSSDTRE